MQTSTPDRETQSGPSDRAGILNGDSHGAGYSWSDTVSSMIERLEKLAAETEEQFLSLGGRLGEYKNRAETLSAMAYNAVSAMSSETLTDAIAGLQSLQSHLAADVRAMEDCLAEALVALTTMKLSVNALKGPLEGFKRVTKSLSNLGVSSRIETARLIDGNEGFTILAENVEKLSSLISTKLTQIRDKAEVLISSLLETERVVSGFNRQETDSGRSMLQNIAAVLDVLKTKFDLCLESGKKISSGSKEISSGLSSVATGMQFHDIARQKLEHVCSALMDASIDEEKASAERESLLQLSEDAREICGLQAHQLINAKDEFLRAANDIHSNLQGMATQIREIADQFRKAVHGGAEDNEASSLAGIEAALQGLLSLLKENSQKILLVSNAMNAIIGIVDGIMVFLTDIEEIGSEIELIALNARVKSASIGVGGAPLGIVSNAIQSLSSEAYRNASDVMSHLETMKSAADQLIAATRKAWGNEDATCDQNDLEGLLSSLRSFNQRVLPLLTDIEKQGEGLFYDLNATVSSFNVHDLFTSEVQADITRLLSISGDALQKGAQKRASTGSLSQIHSRYTMHSEREVHLSFSGQQAGSSQPLTADRQPSKEATDELGDNVELF
jgi:hypothetical protein